MLRNIAIVGAAVVVTSLPFIFRRSGESGDFPPGTPILTIVTPHNEAIRYEFGRAFSAWHEKTFGTAVAVDWRAIGGTSEISRYLTAQYAAAARAWWTSLGHEWTSAHTDVITDRKFNTKEPPAVKRNDGENDDAFTARAAAAHRKWETLRELHTAFRATDDPAKFTSRIDLFFGGGEYDHQKSFQEGLTVPPWAKDEAPADLFETETGIALIPERMSGETWRSASYFGNALSTFGICYNLDRLRDIGVDEPPVQWTDLADARYFGTLGVADPTKSGSIAKAFEMIIHQQCHQAVIAAGFRLKDMLKFETAIGAAKLPPGELPPDIPAEYQQAVEQGWLNGVRLVQRIGANARYFTDSATKVPIDVSTGNASAGIAIDFYGRFQAEASRAPDGAERLRYVTPLGGSGASCDPVSLLRGAVNRDIAVRFISFVLREEGQKLWTYRPGTPGGPHRFALRRLPIRSDFYPSEFMEFQTTHQDHLLHAADNLADPAVNPYAVASNFTYFPRWTGQHFSILRDLVRVMCMDAGAELKSAWGEIISHGGPSAQPHAMELLSRLPGSPEPLTWHSALGVAKKQERMDYMRGWTMFFRESYAEAAAAAGGGS